MLKTGYFARDRKKPGVVSIARFPPQWYTGPCCFTLAPPPELLKLEDWTEYRRGYRKEVLDRLDPDEVLREIEGLAGGPDIILLCFEKDRSHCHRGLVAEWFSDTRGIRIPESGGEGQQTL